MWALVPRWRPYKNRVEHTEAQEEDPMKTEAETGVMQLQAKEKYELAGATRAGERPARALKGSTGLLTL